jgi:lipoprotein-anchoring transpeptidase ErfK/SrfK
MRVSGYRILRTGNVGVDVSDQQSKRVGFWQIAMLTAAASIGAASQADAALLYYQDSDSGYYRPSPSAQPKRQRNGRKHAAGKKEATEKETGAKPQGPLIIAISIDRQKVRVYDSNGLFAESPVSTGMKGHSTPMGVFSIIQKHKFHHSNIYSGAPMPYMQRITWSGVAMHAGVLPGYPASHGCIRMPMAFAMKMWNWTRMGARVVVTPGEMTPANFSHPLLVAQKIVPQPVIADEPKADAPAVKGDKGADAGSAIKSENSRSGILEAGLELRSTVGHASPLREQTRTADASGAMPATNTVTMSDATPSASSLPPSSETVSVEAKPEAAKSEISKPEAEVTPAEKADTASSETKPAEAAAADVKSAETTAVEKKVDEAQAPAPAAGDAAKSDVTASTKVEDKPAEAKVEAKTEVTPEARSDEVKTEAAKVEPVKVEAPKAEVTKADEPKAPETKAPEIKVPEIKAVEKPAEPAKAVADAPAAVDVKKDTARLPGVAAKAEPKRTGQIAVFVSRKDSKLYVRQNFAPLFDVPVTIAPSDRPLGTHVFTAEADKTDPNLLRWSVVTMPVTARNAARNGDDDRAARRRKGAAPAEVKALPTPDSPAEALDRITIPQDAMARITEALTTGGSIIVSDQGINQGETGEGTDFIVSLR